MKKLFTFALAAVAAAFALTGCDKLKEATSKDFTVNGVKFEFSAGVEGGGTRAGETGTFSVTRTVSLAEIGSADLVEYKNKIDKVRANSSLLRVTVSPSGSYTVTGLTVEAAGVAGSPFVVPSLAVGGAFTPPAGMDAFTQAFVMKLVTAGSVQVTVSGTTDAPAGATLGISYENDLVFTASLL